MNEFLLSLLRGLFPTFLAQQTMDLPLLLPRSYAHVPSASHLNLRLVFLFADSQAEPLSADHGIDYFSFQGGSSYSDRRLAADETTEELTLFDAIRFILFCSYRAPAGEIEWMAFLLYPGFFSNLDGNSRVILGHFIYRLVAQEFLLLWVNEWELRIALERWK